MQRKKLPPFDQIQLFFLQVFITVVVNIYNIFIKYIVFLLWNTFKILPRHACIWINWMFTSAMEKKIAGKCYMECKQNN